MYEDKTGAYAELSAKHFNMLSTENKCKMTIIVKSYTEFDWSGCDYLVKFAQEHKGKAIKICFLARCGIEQVRGLRLINMRTLSRR